MDIHELIRFLNRIYVWMPSNNPIRGEILHVIQKLKGQIQ